MIQMTITTISRVLDFDSTTNDFITSKIGTFDVRIGYIEIKNLFKEDIEILFEAINKKDKIKFIRHLVGIISCNCSKTDINKLENIIKAVIDFYDKNDFNDIENIVLNVNVCKDFVINADDAKFLLLELSYI